jgi:carbamoyl-phosphate synthase large subunit
MNILFTSVGRRVALVRSFNQALKKLNIPGKTVAVDLRKTAPALYEAHHHELAPRVDSPNYIDALLDICRRHDIKLLIPLTDTELVLLSKQQAFFKEAGVSIIICSPETAHICANKENTYRFFKEAGFPAIEPVSFEEASREDSGVHFPLFMKPSDGSCSIGAERIDDRKALEFYAQTVENPILQEYIEGEEYTLDLFVDFKGQVRCCVPRLRMETRAGEVSKGMTVRNLNIMAAGKQLVAALPGAMGCITVQCFLTDEGQIKFIEINPRFGGGFPLSAEAGADFPRWLIELSLGREPADIGDSWQEDLVMLRYDDAIFVNRQQIT